MEEIKKEIKNLLDNDQQLPVSLDNGREVCGADNCSEIPANGSSSDKTDEDEVPVGYQEKFLSYGCTDIWNSSRRYKSSQKNS